MQAIHSHVLSFANTNRIPMAARRAIAALRQSLNAAISRDSGVAASAFEPLESRQMMSVSGVPMFDSAHSLGNLTARNHVAARGVVGGSAADVVYSFNATVPMTLNLTMSGLQQSDTAEVLFPDGQVIANQTSIRNTMKLETPLSAGQYEVEVTTREVRGEMAAKRPRISPLVRDFTLQLRGTKYTGGASTQSTDGGDLAVLDAAGGVEEPITETIEDGMLSTTYVNVPNTSLFGTTGQPSPDDVIQGLAGDCWFLSTLSSIAHTDPGLIEQDIVSLGNNQYKVCFNETVNNAPQADWITVDGELPELNSNGNLAFAEVPSNGALWAPLMEKAFCYFREQGTTPNYENIESGFGDEALNDLGATTVSEAGTSLASSYKYAVTASNGTQLESQISQWLSDGDAAVVDSIPDASNGQSYTTTLVGGHQYSVVAVTAAGIELRNPWGDNPVSLSNLNVLNDPSDGGYITITPTQLYNDTLVAFGGEMPQVSVDPTPTPSPTPSPTSQTAIATGTVFSDLNNDSQLDQGDPGISGVTVYATTTQGATYNSSDPSAVSDSNGNFTITGLTAGTTYWFYEQAPSGETVTDGSDGYYATPTAGQTINGIEFGNVQNTANSQLGSATGTVFNDLNDDGNFDQGDPGISGVVVYATTTEDATYQSGDPTAVSDSNGNFTINGLTAGTTWYFYEVAPSGDTMTEGAEGWHATPTAGQTITGVEFGNVVTNPNPSSQLASASGTVFNDLNNDGQLDQGDPGISGITVYATTQQDGAYQSGDPTAVSDSNGNFTITGLTPNVEWHFYEQTPAGYTVTDGSDGWYATPSTGGTISGIKFGNVVSNPTPTPSNPTNSLNIQPSSQYNDITNIDGTLGNNSVTLQDGTVADVYVFTATTTGNTVLGLGTVNSGASPEIEVVDFSTNGSVVNVSNAGASGVSDAFCEFSITAGDQYEVLVASAANAGGSYDLAFANTALSSPEQLTPAWFSSGQSSNIITAPGVAPASGTVFATLPSAFGVAPQPNMQSGGTQTIDSVMGPQSYVTSDGALIDEYMMTAASSSYTTISTSSTVSGFTPDIYVVEFAPDGVETNSWFQKPQGSSNAIGFNTQAGYTYQVFVCSTTGAAGNYQVAYQGSVFNSVQQVNLTA